MALDVRLYYHISLIVLHNTKYSRQVYSLSISLKCLCKHRLLVII